MSKASWHEGPYINSLLLSFRNMVHSLILMHRTCHIFHQVPCYVPPLRNPSSFINSSRKRGCFIDIVILLCIRKSQLLRPMTINGLQSNGSVIIFRTHEDTQTYSPPNLITCLLIINKLA